METPLAGDLSKEVPLPIKHLSLPSRDLIKRQSTQIEQVRARMLRKILIGHKQHILDLGAGFGDVTAELKRRSDGQVFALDRIYAAMQSLNQAKLENIHLLCATAEALPFQCDTLDLVFSQFAIFWMDYLKVIEEVHRILQPGGHFLLIEPDYGGMMEYPASLVTKQLWQRGLRRAGADPMLGRKLPMFLSHQGFDVKVELIQQIQPANVSRFDYLDDLPLSSTEAAQLEEIKALATTQVDAGWNHFAYLPIFLITATRK